MKKLFIMKKLFVLTFLLVSVVGLCAQNQSNSQRVLNYIPENPTQLILCDWHKIGDWIKVEELYNEHVKPELNGKMKKLLTPFFNDWIHNEGSTAIDFNALCAVSNGNLYLPVTGLEPLKKGLKKMKLKGTWETIRGEDGTIYHTYTVSNLLQMVYVDDIVVFSFLPILSSMAGVSEEVAAEVDYEVLREIMKELKSAKTANFLASKDAKSFMKHLTGFDMRIAPGTPIVKTEQLLNMQEYNKMLQENNFAYCMHILFDNGFGKLEGSPQESTAAAYFEQLKHYYNAETVNDNLLHYLSPKAQCIFSNNMVPADRFFSEKLCNNIWSTFSYIPLNLLNNSFVGSINMDKTFTLVAPLNEKQTVEEVLTKDIENFNHNIDIENAFSNTAYVYDITIDALESPEYQFLRDSLESAVKQERTEMLKHHARFQEENKNSNIADTLYLDYMHAKLHFDITEGNDELLCKVSQYTYDFDENFNFIYVQAPILYITIKNDVVIITNDYNVKTERIDDISAVQKRVLDNIHLPFALSFGEIGMMQVDDRSNINVRFEMDTKGENLLYYLLTR